MRDLSAVEKKTNQQINPKITKRRYCKQQIYSLKWKQENETTSILTRNSLSARRKKVSSHKGLKNLLGGWVLPLKLELIIHQPHQCDGPIQLKPMTTVLCRYLTISNIFSTTYDSAFLITTQTLVFTPWPLPVQLTAKYWRITSKMLNWNYAKILYV